jgi:hypothetical protein
MVGKSPCAVPGSGAKDATDKSFYLFGGNGRWPIRCRTRWIAEDRIYVVAPLGTATAVKQHWQASTVLPTERGSPTGQQRLSVELVSAESLLGADSGSEGLLLRIAGPERQTAVPNVHPAVAASNLAAASVATAGT